MTQNLSVTVAANIRAEIARQRVSQADIAARLGLSQAAVSRRLAGITPLRLDELDAIADALDCHIEALLGRSA